MPRLSLLKPPLNRREGSVIRGSIFDAILGGKWVSFKCNSTKIVITDEIEELITHNIFYTAITRAKEKLKIYWTPETQDRILKSLRLRDGKKDTALLASKFGL
jgi:hypothetical protein